MAFCFVSLKRAIARKREYVNVHTAGHFHVSGTLAAVLQ